jgi:hypothetical protein
MINLSAPSGRKGTGSTNRNAMETCRLEDEGTIAIGVSWTQAMCLTTGQEEKPRTLIIYSPKEEKIGGEVTAQHSGEG